MTDMKTECPDVQVVDPAEVEPDEGVDPAARPDIDFLDASLEEKGQQVPVVIARYPAPVGQYKYKMIEGNGRRYCLLKRRRMMTAIILDRVIDRREKIELDFTFNAIRRSMGLAEVALKVEQYIEITGCAEGGGGPAQVLGRHRLAGAGGHAPHPAGAAGRRLSARQLLRVADLAPGYARDDASGHRLRRHATSGRTQAVARADRRVRGRAQGQEARPGPEAQAARRGTRGRDRAAGTATAPRR